MSSRKESDSVSHFTKENAPYGSVLRSNKSSGNVPHDILSELERLKEENDKLRKETVHLLKKNY